MATDLEKLVVSLEANVRSFERQMAKATGEAKKATAQIERQFADASANISRAAGDLGQTINDKLKIALAGVSIAEIGRLSDAWTSAFNKLRATGLGVGEAKAAQEQIVQIADRSRTGFAETADLYARLSRASKDFGATQGQVLVATETVAKSLKLSGASAQETESTLVQLGQALSSGKLQGDELRSLSENAPVLSAAIAKAFGVTVGELKTLGSEGKLTADKVFAAIVSAQASVDEAFARTTGTIADAFSRLTTAATAYIGTSNQVSAVSRAVSGSLNSLATNFGLVADGALALGAIIASRLIAQGLTPAIAAFGATTAASAAASAGFNASAVSAARLGATAGVAGASMRVLGGALALAGGPVGLALMGVAAAAIYFTGKAGESATASQAYAAALAEVEAKASGAATKIRDAGAAADEASQKLFKSRTDQANTNISIAEKEIRDLITTIQSATQEVEAFSTRRISSGDKERALEAIRTALSGTSEDAARSKAALESLSGTNVQFSEALGNVASLIGRLAALRAVAQAAKADLAGVAGDQDAAKRAARKPADSADRTTAANVTTYEREARALADLNDEQKKVKERADKIKKDSSEKGLGYTDAQAQALAKDLIAREDAASKKDSGGSDTETKLAGETKALDEKTQALIREKDALSMSAYEAAKKEAAHRLLKAAEEDETTVTDSLRAKIDEQAAAYARAKTSLDDAKASQQAFNDLQKFVGQSLSGFFSDIVSGGKNASEALMNLTKKLADAALQAVLLGEGPLSGLFGTKGANGATGGLIGTLFGGFGGGSSSVGAPVQLAGATFATGGFTGQGGKYDPAGLVHRGEYVLPKEVVERLGVSNIAALHKAALRGYAAGGLVGGAPGMPVPRLAASGSSGPTAIEINVTGAQGNREIQAMVAAGVQQAVSITTKTVGRNAYSMFRNADMRFA